MGHLPSSKRSIAHLIWFTTYIGTLSTKLAESTYKWSTTHPSEKRHSLSKLGPLLASQDVYSQPHRISTTLYQPHGDNDLNHKRLRPGSWGTSLDQHHAGACFTNRVARVAMHKDSLNPPVISFPDHSKAVRLGGYILFVFVFSICDVYFLQPYGHLLGKDWPLGSLYVMFHCAFVTFQYGVLGQV